MKSGFFKALKVLPWGSICLALLLRVFVMEILEISFETDHVTSYKMY